MAEQHDPGVEPARDERLEDEYGSVLATISNSMVRLYKELFGRGPTKARSYFAGPDILICILAETFTPAERNLVAMGEQERLRDARMFFQHATEDQFKKTVEDILDRRVTAFVSGVDVNRDVAAELFLLEPVGLQSHPGDMEPIAPPEA